MGILLSMPLFPNGPALVEPIDLRLLHPLPKKELKIILGVEKLYQKYTLAIGRLIFGIYKKYTVIRGKIIPQSQP